MAHELFVSDETRTLLEKATAAAAPDSVDAAVCRVTQRNLDLATKLPAELVARRSKLSTQAHEDWVKARKANDFKTFSPILTQMVDIARETADCIGYTDHVYDALTDQFEEGATKASWDAMFDGIRDPLVSLVKEIQSAPNHPDNRFMFGEWSPAEQSKFTEELVQAIGFDFKRGRQDTAPHPFCTNFSIGDVRLTTRYQDYLGASIFGSLHEAGHGMYEQGLPASLAGTGLNQAAGMGLHESQSRFWENFVGRSLPWFRYLAPRLGAIWPDREFVPEKLYAAANRVQRSLVRVESDEATYNLHIIVRFGLELAILEGQVQAADLPAAWDEAYRRVVGVVAPSARLGVLQDVHWSSGLFGYFPSYTIGNLYAASFAQQMLADIPGFWSHVERGEFAPILGWLRTHVHEKGSRSDAVDIFREVVGNRDPVDDLVNHLWSRHGALYGVSGLRVR
jgi:carboxypeptidase Taq